MNLLFAPLPIPRVPIQGGDHEFPVHRIYCIGRNYAEHAREMGHAPDKGQPIFFMKPADAVLPLPAEIRYPSATQNLHHEVELVAALREGGEDLHLDQAREAIYGYAVGVDLTRRDLQAAAKAKGNPWDTAKGFDASAPISAIVPRPGQLLGNAALWLSVNGEMRQRCGIGEMLHSLPEIIVELSRLYRLRAGDLIFTGTPAGVGPLVEGDRVHAGLEGIGELDFSVRPR